MTYIDAEVQREYQRLWVKKRRVAWLKTAGPCRHCGETRHLQIHHKDKKTKIDHKVWSWSEARREKELKKCIVLCRNCHARIHGDEHPLSPHGTLLRYKHRTYPCRCARCKKANAAYVRVQREKIRLRTQT